MEEVAQNGRAILFVSHNLGVVQTLCTRGIFLQKGTLHIDDTAYQCVSGYLKSFESFSQNLLDRTDRRGRGLVKLSKIKITTDSDYSSNTLSVGRPARFTFYLTDIRPRLLCSFTFYDQYGQPIVNFNSGIHGQEDHIDSQMGQSIVCELDEFGLLPGRYRVNVAIFSDDELQDAVEAAVIVDVESGELRGRPIASASGYGSICLHHRWILPA